MYFESLSVLTLQSSSRRCDRGVTYEHTVVGTIAEEKDRSQVPLSRPKICRGDRAYHQGNVFTQGGGTHGSDG